MNKALHVFVYLFVILAGVSLWFAIQLNAKKALLTDRNRLQENFIVQIAATIEQAEPNKEVTAEIKKDVSPIEAKIVDSPETENVLEEYNFYLEQDQLPTYQWENQAIRGQCATMTSRVSPVRMRPATWSTSRVGCSFRAS